MIWLLGGYMWLYVHRPFEVWPMLGTLQVERGYMLAMLLTWMVTPGKGIVNNRIHLALGSFAVVLFASWFMSPYGHKPGPAEVVENFCKVAVFYFLIITTVRDEKSLRLLALLWLTAVGLYMMHSLWEFLHGRYQWRMGTRRMIGVDITFSDPNAFASTLLYTLPILLPFWNERPRRLPKLFILGFVCCIVLCILLTGSRAGFTGLSFLGVMLLFTSAKQKVKALLFCFLVGLVALLVLGLLLPDDLQNRYLTLIDSSRGPENAQTSAEGRIDGFVLGITVWLESPLLGHGPSTFAYATNRGGQAHNLYGQVLSEMGLLGALALSGLLLCFWSNWNQTRHLGSLTSSSTQHDFTYQLSRAIAINVILLLFMGWAGHNLFRYNWQWYAAFSSISVYCLRNRLKLLRQPVCDREMLFWNSRLSEKPRMQFEG